MPTTLNESKEQSNQGPHSKAAAVDEPLTFGLFCLHAADHRSIGIQIIASRARAQTNNTSHMNDVISTF
jgi:hypothetical protein